MDVNCPKCRRIYELDRSTATGEASTVKCNECRHVFRIVWPPDEMKRASSEVPTMPRPTDVVVPKVQKLSREDRPPKAAAMPQAAMPPIDQIVFQSALDETMDRSRKRNVMLWVVLIIALVALAMIVFRN